MQQQQQRQQSSSSMARMRATGAMLVEFYEGSDTSRKAVLNEELSELRRRPEAWRDALEWVSQARDLGSQGGEAMYLAYFAASALEEAVGFLDGEGRRMVRLALFAPVEDQSASALLSAARGAVATPAAVRTRLCKVYVDIGKAAWPQEMPEFLDEICAAALAPDPGTAALGAELLALCAEEFLLPTNRRGITASRQRELRNLVGQHVPQLVGLVTEVLKRPHGEARALLRCLATLVGWAPLAADHASPRLLETLFRIVERDLLQNKRTAIGAVRALDAVLAKRLVPPDMAQLVMETGGRVLSLLRAVTSVLDSSDSEDDDETQELVGMVCELVATFVEQHLPRVVASSSFPVGDLLSLIASLTFSRAVNAAGSLRRTLRPWETVVGFVSENGLHHLAAATGEGLAGVLETLLKTRLLFASNASALDALDEDDASDFCFLKSVRHHHHHHHPEEDDEPGDIEDLILNLAGGEPDPRALGDDELRLLLTESIELIAAAARGPFGTYVADKIAVAALGDLEATLTRAFRNQDKQAAVDAATLLYALAAAGANAPEATLARAATVAVEAARAILREQRGTQQRGAFANLEAAALDALRELVPALAWRAPDDAIVGGALDVAALALDASNRPEPVQRGAAWLVLALAKTGAGHHLSNFDAWAATATSPPRCRALVYRAAACVSISSPDRFEALVAPLAAPLEAAARGIERIGTPLSFSGDAKRDDVVDPTTLEAVSRAARSLAALCAGFAKDGAARGAIATAFFRNGDASPTRRALRTTPSLLAYCAARALRPATASGDPRLARAAASARAPHLAAAAAIVDLLIAASRALGHDKAGAVALDSVRALLAAFDLANPAVSVDRRVSGSRPPRAAALYLLKAACQILAAVAADNEASAKRSQVVPDACDLIARHVAPLAADADLKADLFPALVQLAKRLLVDQWAAFVKPSSRKTECRDDRATHFFDAICDLLAAAVRGLDLPATCVRAAILALHDAHAKHRLYDFPPFHQRWRAPLADALFDALLDRRHDSLKDDLAATLQHLIDPAFFFSTWLPHKLAALPNLTHDQRHSILAHFPTDPHLFLPSLADAIADLDHYQAINTTTPLQI